MRMRRSVCCRACANIEVMCLSPPKINSRTAMRRPPVSVSGYNCRVFVCYKFMFNASLSYTIHEGVTINFSVASYYCLRQEIHLTDMVMT